MASKINLTDVLNNQFKSKDDVPYSNFPSLVNSIAILLLFTISFYGIYVYSSFDRLKFIWPEKKCSPDMTFMAGLFQPEDDPRSWFKYTYDVFSECNKNILFSIIMSFFKQLY